MTGRDKNIRIGMGLAVLATLIWSGNFLVVKALHGQIAPVSLAFCRWATASLLLLPFAWRPLRRDYAVIRKAIPYFLATAFAGITLFNTFVYIGSVHTTAINSALVSATSSPIIAILLAAIFLGERLTWPKLAGLLLCIAGVATLLSRGSLYTLLHLHFSHGDLWVLAAGFVFAVYTNLVKRKPAGISNSSFLFVIFFLGTVMLLPFLAWELRQSAPVEWNFQVIGIIAYLATGTSIASYLIWNQAVQRLGAGRTALFGNLIPAFSTIEAVILFGETVTWAHIIGFLLVIGGLLVANISRGASSEGSSDLQR